MLFRSPTGIAVGTSGTAEDLRERWPNVAEIRAGEVWDHKGVEYDAVLVDAAGMTPAEVYLAASRAAHELVVVGQTSWASTASSALKSYS